MANLQLHPGKCMFVQPQIQYLGIVLPEKRISASPNKVKAMRDYSAPKNVKDFRAFLGLASFYRRLVPGVAEAVKPLMELTKKDRQVIKGSSQQKTVEDMDSLCTTSLLA